MKDELQNKIEELEGKIYSLEKEVRRYENFKAFAESPTSIFRDTS